MKCNCPLIVLINNTNSIKADLQKTYLHRYNRKMIVALRHQLAFQLTILATAAQLTLADWNPDSSSTVDILPDASCPDYDDGRLPTVDCSGFVDCMNGFEVDRARCVDGTLYSEQTENCEPSDTVICQGALMNDGPVRTTAPSTCDGEGQCITADGECAQIHYCLVDPCEMNSCEENQECVADYCGGCQHTCSLKLNVVDQLISERPPPTSTSSTSPQIVYDGTDATAVFPTTTAPKAEPTIPVTTTEVPATAVQFIPDVVQIASETDETKTFIPSWTERTCIPETDSGRKDMNKRKNRRLRSTWHSSYSTQYECCVENFIYSLELFESCIGFDLDTLEPEGNDVDYYPQWNEGKCKVADGTEDGWLASTFQPKKYLCCFEYFKWDFDNCLIA
jgi:hypothetical protein